MLLGGPAWVRLAYSLGVVCPLCVLFGRRLLEYITTMYYIVGSMFFSIMPI